MDPREDSRIPDIKIQHPDFGYVLFHGCSARQLDILKNYNKLVKNAKNSTKIKKKN